MPGTSVVRSSGAAVERAEERRDHGNESRDATVTPTPAGRARQSPFLQLLPVRRHTATMESISGKDTSKS